jgi:hypothetical protein
MQVADAASCRTPSFNRLTAELHPVDAGFTRGLTVSFSCLTAKLQQADNRAAGG